MSNTPIFYSNNASRGMYQITRKIDADDVSLFDVDLTTYEAKDFDIIKAPLTAFNVFTNTPVGKFDDIYSYGMFEGNGESKYANVKTGMTDDAPLVGGSRKKYNSPIHDLECAMVFSRADLLVSQKNRESILSSLMRQAIRSNYERMNKTCFYGYPDLGLPGLLNNKLLPAYSNAYNAGVTTDLSTSRDADTLLKALNAMLMQVDDQSGGLIAPDTLLVSPKIWTNLSMTFWGTSGLTATVEMTFEKLSNVKIIKAPELSGKLANGNNKDVAILFKNDPDFVSHIMAEPFEALPLQPKGFRYYSYCSSRHGGLVITQPKAFCIYTAS